MTIDDAIRILDPQTTAEALAEVEYYGKYSEPEAVIKAVEDACRIAIAAMERTRWIPCSERLPDTETEVLALCRRGGVSFVCPAMHEDGTIITSESIWNWNEIEGYGLYSEEADDWFIPEGWWEYRQFNDDDVYNNVIDCTVTHWMPLPEGEKIDG